MADIKWLEGNRIQVNPPKRPKKITGTRFASILGLNPWSTEFEIWCAITKTYEEPFEDTIYTVAGKTIEPKQADYMKKSYAMTNLVTPTDVFGEDYFNKTYGDFFKDSKIFGGMWDYLLVDNGTPNTVLEMKTTKRAEDWQNDVPEYYALQGSLYAYLLGVDDVIMVCSFLEDKDYEDPSKFTPNATNTITVDFKVSERYPDFADKVATLEKWWGEHIVSGISPEFDEKKDAEILKVLRTNSLNPESDVDAILKEAETLAAEIEEVTKTVEEKEKRLKVLKDQIKEYASGQFKDGDKYVTLTGSRLVWTLTKGETKGIDKKALEKDGLLSKYETVTPKFTLTNKVIKED